MVFAKIKTIVVCISLCFVAPATAAPDPRTFEAQLNTYVQSEMRKAQIPGVAIAVLKKGRIVVAKGYGIANVEHNVPVTTKTIFQSGSLGKMFTAAVVMKEVERGRLNLNDPISKYITGFPASWRPITIRHLLTHTSGIPNVGDDFDFKLEYTDDALIKSAAALPLLFKPGSRWSYSNTGYVLLGIIVKRAIGREYWDILQSDVFNPLGMKTARVISSRDIVPNRAGGYELVNGALKNADYVSAKMNTTADGSLYFSLDDLIAWSRGIDQRKVLRPESWKQIFTPVRLNSGRPHPYGLGWELGTAKGQQRPYHGGTWQGFKTFFSRYLADDLSIILLANSMETDTDKFVEGIAKLWDPALVTKGPRPKPEPEIDRRVSALIEKARLGQFREADVPLVAAASIPSYNRYFAKIMKQLGALTRLDLIARQQRGDDLVYSYVAWFGDRAMEVRYAISTGDRVSQFSISD